MNLFGRLGIKLLWILLKQNLLLDQQLVVEACREKVVLLVVDKNKHETGAQWFPWDG